MDFVNTKVELKDGETMRGAERRMQTQVEGEWSGGAGWACLPGAKTLESAILFSPLS